MATILKFLTGSLGPYMIGAALLAITLGFASCSVQTERLDVKASELKQKTEDLNKVVKANQDNEKIVASLQAELDKWKASAEKAAHHDQEVVDEQKQTEQELTVKDQQLASQQEKIDRALPNCQKLLTMDIGAICPGHAALDRMRAADHLSRQGSKSPGPGNPAH